MTYALITATQDHCLSLAPRLRRYDVGTPGIAPLEALETTFSLSISAWTWTVDDTPAAMVGIVVPNLVGDTALPWVMATELVNAHRREFWRASKVVLGFILERYPRLEGYCDARFAASQRWLKRLGFHVESPTKTPYYGIDMCPFSIG